MAITALTKGGERGRHSGKENYVSDGNPAKNSCLKDGGILFHTVDHQHLLEGLPSEHGGNRILLSPAAD